jgi:hypothetical protein
MEEEKRREQEEIEAKKQPVQLQLPNFEDQMQVIREDYAK